MRRMICDIIDHAERFEVADEAVNGLEALEFLQKKSYDGVVLDISMPKMDGLQLLAEIKKSRIPAKVMVVSSYTYEGAKTTLEALSLGALDFLQKPVGNSGEDQQLFKTNFLSTLEVVVDGEYPSFEDAENKRAENGGSSSRAEQPPHMKEHLRGSRTHSVVAIASSTGGPRALQSVIPYLPEDLDAPVLLVQHMPKGFTLTLAERLDRLSKVHVKEAEEGEEIQNGVVYVAMGGMHMKVQRAGGDRHVIRYSDEPPREGVKPSANYMYESLADCGFERIVCAVLTGMGADGMEGIKGLRKRKNISVIAQDKETSTVYGMPMNVMKAGLADLEAPLDQVAKEIVALLRQRNI
ncbi:MAG: chemotaxis-specific protein-glutamate methyltransferase CheB [Clostridium sp.]|nr:chemotaxis-specific protein-glutamate methyltransferase CheB [Acetatifactor muris]MCM1525994.1 chemotaxis-specific protein-glutamate methyltransferase CheB [Bacteroides sp.]MCM1562246.1 chemotaxis-specific protein-glutamate methyltransferase CheB [Clostridium sp.]